MDLLGTRQVEPVEQSPQTRTYGFFRPTTDRASLATSLSLIGPLTPVPPGDSASSPEVTRCSSVPCCPQTPWCGWMNENAFASNYQARPCSTLADRFITGSPH